VDVVVGVAQAGGHWAGSGDGVGYAWIPMLR